MENVVYTSGNKFFIKTDLNTMSYSSQKIENYVNNIKSIKQRNDWKTSGTGARFMGTYIYDVADDFYGGSINGASFMGDEIIYSATTGEVGGIYRKTLQKDAIEGHITASQNILISKIAVFNDNCVVSIGNENERHIATLDVKTGRYRELTEGDVLEDYPSYSKDGKKIYFSCAGVAFSSEGESIDIGPYGILFYDNDSGTVEEVVASNKFNYIAPKEDKDGNLMFIKRPYSTSGIGMTLIDIVLFPIRIIKAIGGWLNFFSIRYGGEALSSGRDVKSKQKSKQELFFEGNIINAQKTLKENKQCGEKFPGIIPRNWELTRLEENGKQTCIKKGVMDYTVCENGDIIYSNGNAVIRLSVNGSEQLLEKSQMAENLIEINS